jgi:hypothetical protein
MLEACTIPLLNELLLLAPPAKPGVLFMAALQRWDRRNKNAGFSTDSDNGVSSVKMMPTEIGSGFHEPQYPVRTPSCRLNLRLIHRTVSKVMTPIDKKS